MYNEKYGILFKFSPLMQCILGKFEGWRIILEAYNDARKLKEDDQILFIYSNASQYNKLLKHIQKDA